MVADEKISLTLLQSSRWRRDITPSSLSTSKLIWSCSSHGVRVTDEDPATVPILLKNANIDTTTDKPKKEVVEEIPLHHPCCFASSLLDGTRSCRCPRRSLLLPWINFFLKKK